MKHKKPIECGIFVGVGIMPLPKWTILLVLPIYFLIQFNAIPLPNLIPQELLYLQSLQGEPEQHQEGQDDVFQVKQLSDEESEIHLTDNDNELTLSFKFHPNNQLPKIKFNWKTSQTPKEGEKNVRQK